MFNICLSAAYLTRADTLILTLPFLERLERARSILYCDRSLHDWRLLREDTRENWIAKFRAAGVPAGSVRDLSEALHAPETRERNLVAAVEHPSAGKVESVTSPIRYSGTPVSQPVAAPLLGQHSAAVLRDAGFSAEEIAALADNGIIVGETA